MELDSDEDDDEEAVSSCSSSASSDAGTSSDYDDDVGMEVAILPPARELPTVVVDFTPTLIDTLPARETREKEIKLLHRKKPDATEEDTDVTERHPIFLKEKGDRLWRNGDMKGAIQAYTRALELEPMHVASLCNRAACFLRVGNNVKAEEDCSTAIQMLQDEAEDNEHPENAMGLDKAVNKKKLLLKLRGRLAKAQCAQGRFQEGLYIQFLMTNSLVREGLTF